MLGIVAYDLVGIDDLVLDAIALGQLQATGTLQDMGVSLPGGRAVALIDVEEDTSGYNIPGGAAAQVALYFALGGLIASPAHPPEDAELGELRVLRRPRGRWR